ncbi:lysine N6-hydroxylase [Nocardioides luteus]|uniref:L-lysine N6-monooxygenase MbtG n=1 Tax=Nocardioides luteus TaxID=1844 RepID=A0ABQ5SSX1_9ACTN|nr:SidA/IucD/PvdA family monooxygenase [Nocardioides luteus]MDR7311391.1 lysine N6-hydroxylase [Nocardioides luteus]GGR65582.1 monooxygenase [Nocardioides luteus]GLJ66896.1 monooxygenase [Nocardioides luteus]
MTTATHVHDLIGIGLGPFNLGLAALADPIDELDCLFLEGREKFDWHPGMMLDEATLQVPFLADLVTMADPTSRFSFLNFLKQTGRIYPFYIRENFLPHRREYNHYCQWVAERLDSVRFGQQVVSVEHDGETYVVTTASGETHLTRRLVLGTGTSPRVPECAAAAVAENGPALHSADYLTRRDELVSRGSITVVGSGQSAAEVYLDLLSAQPDHDYQLAWLTRSPRFFSMEYTKLTLELTSPEYSAYFQSLPSQKRERLLKSQQSLYKGISGDTIDAIHEALYTRSVGQSGGGVTGTTLLTNTEVRGVTRTEGGYHLALHHVEQEEDYEMETEALVLATGYRAGLPGFLEPIRDRLRLDDQGRYAASATFSVDTADREIWVQNGEEHTHGFVAPDLGMGAYRSSVILAAILGREPYPVEKRVAFQEFGVPDRFRIQPRVSTSSTTAVTESR